MEFRLEEATCIIKENYENLNYSKSDSFEIEFEYDLKRDKFGLDEIDYAILEKIFSVRKLSLLENKPIQMKLATLMKSVYKVPSLEKYLILVSKLFRLTNLNYYFDEWEGYEYSMINGQMKYNYFRNNSFGYSSILHSVELKPKGNLILSVTFGSNIYELFINTRLRNMYYEEYESLSTQQRDVLSLLLKKRIKAYFDEEVYAEMNMSYKGLGKDIMSPSQQQIKEEVESGLKEIKRLRILNFNYRETKTSLIIEISPFNDEEISDLNGSEESIRLKDLFYLNYQNDNN